MNILKAFLKEIGIILLYFTLGIILQLILGNDTNKLLFTLSNITCNLIILIVFLVIFRHSIISKWEDFKKNHRSYFKKTFKYYLIGFLIMFISLNIINYFYNNPTTEITNQNLLKTYPFYFILNSLIFAPIIEELMTRVYLKDTFKNKIIYVLISGLIFALLHIINPLLNGSYYELFYLIPYGAMGCSLSYIYMKTDNIWANITYHSFHNFICLLLSLI